MYLYHPRNTHTHTHTHTHKNTTSWVLLDLATLYWRARGNPYNGVECIRRALHYSPQYVIACS